MSPDWVIGIGIGLLLADQAVSALALLSGHYRWW